MRYLLDSDIVTDLYDKSAANHSRIAERLSRLEDSDEVFISIISIYEFEYGLANAPGEKRGIVETKIAAAQKDFEVVPLSPAGARQFGLLKKSLKGRRSLKKENLKKHSVDLIIAAAAIEQGCVLVSADRVYSALAEDFSQLRVESWLARRVTTPPPLSPPAPPR